MSKFHNEKPNLLHGMPSAILKTLKTLQIKRLKNQTDYMAYQNIHDGKI